MKKLHIYIIISIIFSLFLGNFYLPIILKSNNILDEYTTASNDPENFNYGVNINTGIPYYIHACYFENTFSDIFNPRIVVIHSNYNSNTRINIWQYKRGFFGLDLLKMVRINETIGIEDANKKYSEYCKKDLSELTNVVYKDELLQYKYDAQNPPQIDYNDPKIQQKIKAGQDKTP